MPRKSEPFWDWDINEELIGTLKGQLTGVGKFKKRAFVFQLDNGAEAVTWAYAHLINLIMPLPFGTRVKLKYCGTEENPDNGYRQKAFEMDILPKLEKAVKVKKKNERKKRI